jgi:hypothetical protein
LRGVVARTVNLYRGRGRHGLFGALGVGLHAARIEVVAGASKSPEQADLQCEH